MGDKRTKETCGADEHTPSKAQYFTWINNTNEGSTEAQTLVNLDFFAFLKREYGMTLDIYAWDAGNLDGANKTYADFSKGKLKAQYPNGYAPIVKAAAQIGTRMGVWGGTDGYGNSQAEEDARRELLVSFCRDYNFALFKFDRVCGKLRFAKRPAFAKTMRECRKYCPDLVLLLHRNKVGKEYIYATTDLWQWRETYVDGNSYNDCTAPHHRAFAFTRGLTPNLTRLMEDHGVCISSYNDYFEDDLIIQAFQRCLILAPEIYANPFFLRDHEYAMLARIFNLHRLHRDILVNGNTLPASYGKYAVVRGDGKRKFIITSNASWENKYIQITINEDLHIDKADSYTVIRRFPTESVLGNYKYGESLSVDVAPFRACMVEVVDTAVAEPALAGCDYLTLHEVNGVADKVKIVRSEGKIYRQIGNVREQIADLPKYDHNEPIPKLLGSMNEVEIPKFDRMLYEAAMFAADNDSMEAQAIKRAGDTVIPEVKKAREEFFKQATYVNRGCESKAMFDGNSETFFDSRMPSFIQPMRLNFGTLRVDLGEEMRVDSIEIDYFKASNCFDLKQMPPQPLHIIGEYSSDLGNWKLTKGFKMHVLERGKISKLVKERVNNIIDVKGKLVREVYTINDTMRYFLLPFPMYRIYAFNVRSNGKVVKLNAPHANNLMSAYCLKKTKKCYSATVQVPSNVDTNYFISIAVNGVHGKEGVYCAGICDGKVYGMDDRAPAYHVNTWQHEVMSTDANNTYYLYIKPEMIGKEITLYALFNQSKISIDSVDVYLCHRHEELNGVVLKVER